MVAKWLIPVLAGLILAGAGDENTDRSPQIYPVITGVWFTAEDGTLYDTSEKTELTPGVPYTLTATIQANAGLHDPVCISEPIPEGYTLRWECDFGSFEGDLSGNDLVWIAPEEEGMIIFSLVLSDDGDLPGSEYRKSFAVWVGEMMVRSDYARDHVLVMVQDWCTEADVADLARYWPCTGEYRLIARSINAWTLDIDPEIDVFEAVREITWWTIVVIAEPDFVVEFTDPVFDDETQTWGAPGPG